MRAFLVALLLPLHLSQQTAMSLVPTITTVSTPSTYSLQQFTLSTISKGSVFTLDFSSSQITPPSGSLTMCQSVSLGVTSTLTCSCTNKVCTITLAADLSPYVVQINLGPLTNPASVSAQSVTGSLNGASQSITVTEDKYSPGKLVKVSMTQSSQKVAEYNDMTLQFRLTNAIPPAG